MSETGTTSVINLRSLGWNLAFLLLSIVTAVITYFGLTQLHRHTNTAHQQALAQKVEAATSLARAKEDESDMRARIVLYNELIKRGRTAPEHRLEWVETMKNIKESHRLLGLEYEIAPQRRLEENASLAGGYTFLVSPMRIEIPLLHENDLFGFIADLSAQVKALVSTRNCRIERLPVPAQPNAPLLKALCNLEWITLEEKT